MTTRPTLGRLWELYGRARAEAAGLRAAGRRGPGLRRAERRADQLRDRLVVNYSPLVKYVAGRMAARIPGGVDQEELISWGVVGLLQAVETFDPSRGAKFETYAISKIRWAILDELRKADPLPRRVRRRVRETQRATGTLTQTLRRVPTEAEVAREVGVGLAEHRETLERHHRVRTWSLEEILSGMGEGGRELSLSDPAAETSELQERLAEAIESLSERERVVITFYYYQGLTLREIGRALNLTEGRISQILRRAILRLRDRLSGV